MTNTDIPSGETPEQPQPLGKRARDAAERLAGLIEQVRTNMHLTNRDEQFEVAKNGGHLTFVKDHQTALWTRGRACAALLNDPTKAACARYTIDLITKLIAHGSLDRQNIKDDIKSRSTAAFDEKAFEDAWNDVTWINIDGTPEDTSASE